MARDIQQAAETRAMTAGSFGLFLLMSLIWGATWIAIKAGVTAVPPILFAGVRYGLVAAVSQDWSRIVSWPVSLSLHM
jgi:drug/metabolite transporter (DMT)-like permease